MNYDHPLRGRRDGGPVRYVKAPPMTTGECWRPGQASVTQYQVIPSHLDGHFAPCQAQLGYELTRQIMLARCVVSRLAFGRRTHRPLLRRSQLFRLLLPGWQMIRLVGRRSSFRPPARDAAGAKPGWCCRQLLRAAAAPGHDQEQSASFLRRPDGFR